MLDPEAQYQKNLNYFKNAYPYLYDLANRTELQSVTLYKNDVGIDIHSGNSFFYNGNAEIYANREVNDFLAKIDYGKPIRGLQPHGDDAFVANRYFSKRITKLYKECPSDLSDTYTVPNFFPLLIMMGIGSGLHIKKMVEEKNIISLVIYETNPEEFVTSLYLMDWEPIFKTFSEKGKSIQLICSNIKIAEDQYAILWNHLIDQTPSFSLAAFFFNHRKQTKYSKVIKRIQNDLKVYLNLWGYYDDEANQMNNALHNLYDQNKLIPKQNAYSPSVPAFIIGSGPSLDKRIEEIRRFQNKAIIFSAGTALRALHSYGIKPDFHIEIESHYEPFKVISEIDDQAYLDQIQLIGAAQLTPKLVRLFNNTHLFVKDSTAILSLVDDLTDRVHGTTPTCTNTAFGLAAYFNFREIYFFGTDYGFRDTKSHHSKSSIYYSENSSDLVKKSTQYDSKSLLKVPDIEGKEILTTQMYNASRRRIESDYKYFKRIKDVRLYNCSLGADIAGSIICRKVLIDNEDTSKDEVIKNILNGGRYLNKQELDSRFKNLIGQIKSIIKEIKSVSTVGNTSLIEHYKNITAIGQYLSYGLEKYGQTRFIVRGSIWHFLHAGASLSLKLQDDQHAESHLISLWEEIFFEFLENIPEHLMRVYDKPLDDSDPWINTHIRDQSIEDYL